VERYLENYQTLDYRRWRWRRLAGNCLKSIVIVLKPYGWMLPMIVLLLLLFVC